MSHTLIDVHIAQLPGEEILKPWKLFGNETQTYFVESKPGNCMVTRRDGFSKGDSPFVSFIDPDDMILTDPWKECLAEHEKGNYSIVYTNSVTERGVYLYPKDSVWEKNWHWTQPAAIHQIAVMRRDMIEESLYEIFRQPRLVQRARFLEMHVIYAHMVRQAPAKLLSRLIAYRYNMFSGNKARLNRVDSDHQYVIRYIHELLTGAPYETQ